MQQFLQEHGRALIAGIAFVIIVTILIGSGIAGSGDNLVNKVGQTVEDSTEVGNSDLDVSHSVPSAAGNASISIKSVEAHKNNYYSYSHFITASGTIKSVKIQSAKDQDGNDVLISKSSWEAQGCPAGYIVVDNTGTSSEYPKIMFTEAEFAKVKLTASVMTDKNTKKTLTQSFSLDVLD